MGGECRRAVQAAAMMNCLRDLRTWRADPEREGLLSPGRGIDCV